LESKESADLGARVKNSLFLTRFLCLRICKNRGTSRVHSFVLLERFHPS
jgi:hypothetical protein